MRLGTATFLALLPFHAAAETIGDAALAECQSGDIRFTSVASCLPETHVAIAMLEALSRDDTYGHSGSQLADECIALNDTSPAAWACAKSAIRDAVGLLQMVGDASRISAPLFAALSDPRVLSDLEKIEDAEKAEFDVMMWGGGMYRPLR
jgi:hypothetical protein